MMKEYLVPEIPEELIDMPVEAKPNLFIPGFPKCGTSALAEYLKQHKDIYVIDGKEPGTLVIDLPPSDFALAHLNGKRPIWKIYSTPYSLYKAAFYNNKDKKYRVDATQPLSSLNNRIHVPLYIRKFSPQAKIILMIREQRKRLISFYAFTRTLTHTYEFDTWLERVSPYIEDFLFYNKVQQYHQTFNSNLLVIVQDALLHDPQKVMDSVFDFLGLEKIDISEVSVNESFYIKSRVINRIVNHLEHYSHVIAGYLNKSSTGRKVIAHVLRPLYRQYRYYFTKLGSKTHLYNKLLSQIPSSIQDILVEDYEKTRMYCKEHGVLIS